MYSRITEVPSTIFVEIYKNLKKIPTTELCKNPPLVHHWSKVPSTIWSHNGQKDRFVIFGCGRPKWINIPEGKLSGPLA